MTPFMPGALTTGMHDHVQGFRACQARIGGREQIPEYRSGYSMPVEIRGLYDPATEESPGRN